MFLGFEIPETVVNLSEMIRSQKKFIGFFVYSKQQFTESIVLVECCNDSWVKPIKFDQVEDNLIQFLDGDFSCVKPALTPNA